MASWFSWMNSVSFVLHILSGYVDPSRKGVNIIIYARRSSKKAFYENPDAYLKHVKYSVEFGSRDN